MMVAAIVAESFCYMKGKEGVVVQDCGGDLHCISMRVCTRAVARRRQ